MTPSIDNHSPSNGEITEEQLLEEVRKTNTLPLWTQMTRLNPPEPNPICVPFVWKYKFIRPNLLTAGKLITEKKAERRVLMLVNPAREAPYTTDTLYAGLQLVMPNETAPAHRHTAFAMRFIIEGNGGFTAVHGRRICMQQGDVILTPTWNYHDHGKDGSGPMIWLDGLDLPNFRHFPVHFVEHYAQPRYPAEDVDSEQSPLVFPWAKMKAELDSADEPWVTCRYFRSDGHEVSRILGGSAERISPGCSSPRRRETTSAVYHVVSGSGYSVIGETKFSWEKGDTFCVPAWYPYEHFADPSETVYLYRKHSVKETLSKGILVGHEWKPPMGAPTHPQDRQPNGAESRWLAMRAARESPEYAGCSDPYIAISVQSCRLTNPQCDGSRPKCSLCIDLGFECVYTPPATATNVIIHKDYLTSLESRVRALEETLSAVEDHVDDLSSRLDRGDDPKNRHDPKASQDVEPVSDLAGVEDAVDAMGAVVFADEEDSGFFGPSSNIAFLRHLSQAVTSAGKMQSELTSPSLRGSGQFEGGFLNVSRPPSPTLRHSDRDAAQNKYNIFTLPPSNETSELIQRYFSDTGLLFPYLHEPTFRETYGQLVRDGFTKVRRTWLGLLNMVLAMATITASAGNTRADARIKASDVFYQRALGLCGKEILRGTTLERGVRYSSISASDGPVPPRNAKVGSGLDRAWIGREGSSSAGVAFAGSVQGLFSSGARNPEANLVWLTLSMTFGRPAAIPDHYVKLELPAHHESMRPFTMLDDGSASLSLAFFNSTITLYKQMWNVIDLLYGQNLGCDRPSGVSETVAHVFRMEQHLISWERSLPDTLRLTCARQLQGEEQRQEPSCPRDQLRWKLRVILTLRYLNLRVLLHRPILTKFIDARGKQRNEEEEDGRHESMLLLKHIGTNSVEICVNSAMDIIDLVHEVVHAPGWQRSLLGAWWFSLYYTFNAALVILGALWVCRGDDSDEASVPPDMDKLVEKASGYPQRAVAALLNLDSGNKMVDRCRYYLEHFNNALNPVDVDGMPVSNHTTLFADTTARLGPGQGQGPSGTEMIDFSTSLGMGMEMELGEFLLDDGEQLRGLINVNRSGSVVIPTPVPDEDEDGRG
ncbi:Uncharacterized protein T310_2993 [Rasamsonia emersonii CBS 393.64]|uniref:Gentisate 1,2-dioxygenase n=1 Tax=Rasamsonia emersonii (strain ATCC 16479 / CBS 393.64 / IMI 116815) TaxID=1408163 RepID=A0A0F4YXL5_RASE3|nr:Uncharacterized protein T310_2993 [Rasamsonia emersonii CBS 393.64]KKA22979.1 Uncharacterized protein T310_2993 [Rasamsonia emersonii CBS 393.64]